MAQLSFTFLLADAVFNASLVDIKKFSSMLDKIQSAEKLSELKKETSAALLDIDLNHELSDYKRYTPHRFCSAYPVTLKLSNIAAIQTIVACPLPEIYEFYLFAVINPILFCQVLTA